MLHTCTIAYDKLDKLHNDLPRELLSQPRMLKVEENSNIKQRIYTTKYYSDIGFKDFKLREVLKPLTVNNVVEISLNPMQLILEEETPLLLLESDVDELKFKFNQKIKEIHPRLPRLSEWSVRRIDYAVDIKTEYVEEYIELFKQCDFPRRFECKSKEYNPKQKRKTEKKGLFKLESNSVNINFYDKENERLAVAGNVQGCENILRLEIQCKRDKTDNIKRRKDCKFPNKSPDHFFDSELSKKMILEYYDLIIGSGDYYKLDEAIKKVRAASKDHLVNTLKLINQKSSAWKAREAFVKGFRLTGGTNKSISGRDEATFKSHIRELASLGINPVTLPKRYKMDFLPNPTTLAFK